MLAEERRSRILELFSQKSVVTLAELAAFFETSEMTIRRDLDALAERGVCQRVRGGAIALRRPENRNFAYPSYFSREQVQAAEKRAVAQAAASLINPGDTVALDSGTTMTMLADAARHHEGITVISNSLQVLDRLRNAPGVVAISPGGIVAVEDMGLGEVSFAGPMTVSALRAFRPRRAFISASGVELAAGIFNAGLFQAEIKRTLMEIAAESILVVDSSKFGRANGVLVAPLAGFRTVITDTGARPDVVSGLRQAGIEVILVEPTSEPLSEDSERVASVLGVGA
jgi:DeoR family transcriptional regulator of aga operon/DeoR family fructose operon transcriptional repressor